MQVRARPGPQQMPAEREDEVRQTLKELDPLLDLKWLPFARVRADGSYEGRYALTCKWPQNDGRWELYRRGEIGEPYDILGIFEVEEGKDGILWHSDGTKQAMPVSPDMVMDRTLELLAECDSEREDWKERVRRSAEHNRELVRKRREEMVDEAKQGLQYYQKKLRKEPIVGVGKNLKEKEQS